MLEKFKSKLLRRSTALVVVVALFTVGVIGEHYVNGKNTTDNNVVNQVAQGEEKFLNYDFSALEMNNQKLKSPGEVQLATTDTGIGKISEELVNAYEIFYNSVIEDADNIKEAAYVFKSAVTDLKKEMNDLLAAEVGNNAKEYKNYVEGQFEVLEGKLSALCTDRTVNPLATVEEISDIICPEMEVADLSDDLSFNDVTVDDIKKTDVDEESEKIMESSEVEHADESLYNKEVASADTEETNDTIINEAIKNEYASMSVLDIYQNIKNNYNMQFYYGSRKGAIGTYEQKSGNDYDIASLFIGILREKNIPAKYVKGQISITTEQAMEWTGASDIESAAKVMGALGIPVVTVGGNDGIKCITMEHIWVLAYVPYTDYRGTGNQAGERLWIPLDPSFKKVEFIKDIDITSVGEYINNEENFINVDTTINDYNIGNLAEYVEGENSAFLKYMMENGYGEDTSVEAFGGIEIIEEDLGYLPLSTPYEVTSIEETFDDIADEATDSITVSLGSSSALLNALGIEADFTVDLLAPDIYGKRITIAYDPATEEDQAIIDKYNGIFNTPAYLIKLVPRLYIDGKVVAEGKPVAAGTQQRYNIEIHESAPSVNDGNESNLIVVGGMYSIVLDYGSIAADELKGIAEEMKALQTYISEENGYAEETMGKLIWAVSRAYFAQLDAYNEFVAGQQEVIQTRALSLGVVGFGVNGAYVFGRATELNEGGLFLDISHDVHSVVSLNNNNTNEKEYMLQTGIYASAMEHGVLEQFTGVESVSTIKALQYAVQNDIAIHIISANNYVEEIAQLNVADAVINDIKSAVSTGKIVIIPEEIIQINQWSGSGYMVLDSDTYACGYMISGGLSGGAMTINEMFFEYVSQVLMGIAFMIMWEVVTTALLAMCPCGWVLGLQMIINFAQVLMFMSAITEMIELLVLYAQTGDVVYLQELLIQIASMVTLAAISNLAADKINSLKEAVVEEIEAAGLKGGCFIAGTLVATTMGMVAIENINAGDYVYSFNPGTLKITEKAVEDTFIKEVSELINVSANGERITTTINHPFYVLDRGFVQAIDLRVGDILTTVNGEKVIVEQIQHEILERPVNVYNFSVEDNHTYFVGESSVGVHNDYAPINSGLPEVDNFLSKLKETTSKGGSARNFEASGGYNQTVADFYDFNPTNVKTISTKYGEGLLGFLANGKKIVARQGSATGGPTLEFQISNSKIFKVRY